MPHSPHSIGSVCAAYAISQRSLPSFACNTCCVAGIVLTSKPRRLDGPYAQLPRGIARYSSSLAQFWSEAESPDVLPLTEN